uniref:Auto-transporter adhesin head GIN domain-containing protein n=1 Tax=Haptolina ericina TaxID=156174 RepID=A0A7S3BVV2_9EUKA|mmetsp:Transcript_69470/g.154901  ORF Transcript_69470/g.154901 Transcript_69470/m.154901 type:complete len:219 (+) Transcript_69470:35-691(+)
MTRLLLLLSSSLCVAAEREADWEARLSALERLSVNQAAEIRVLKAELVAIKEDRTTAGGRRLSERFFSRRLQSGRNRAVLHLHGDNAQVWFGTGTSPDLKMRKKSASLVAEVSGKDVMTVSENGVAVSGALTATSLSGDGTGLTGVLHSSGVKVATYSFSKAAGCVTCESGRSVISGGGSCRGQGYLVSSSLGAGTEANGWCVSCSAPGANNVHAICG